MRIYGFADEASGQIDGQIKALVRNGLQGLEIRNVDGVNVSDIPPQKANEVFCKLYVAGLKTWAIGSPIGKEDILMPFAPQLEKLKRTIQTAQILQADRIRIFSFYLPKGEDPALYKNEVIDRLGKMCELAEAEGILLCHENEKEIFGDTAARCRELLDAIPQLQAVFDPANFIQCKQDVLPAWALLEDRVSYLHLKDALADGTVVPAGAGVGQLRILLQKAAARRIADMTIEPHLSVFDGFLALEKGEHQQLYRYPNTDAAFDAACQAVKDLLQEEGL